jgi:hypothetical protein
VGVNNSWKIIKIITLPFIPSSTRGGQASREGNKRGILGWLNCYRISAQVNGKLGGDPCIDFFNLLFIILEMSRGRCIDGIGTIPLVRYGHL